MIAAQTSLPLRRWLGIDFSGDHLMWRPNKRTNVWIADVRRGRGQPVLHDLRRVTDLAGLASPFDRLSDVLRAGEFDAAAIDAPFSVQPSTLRQVIGNCSLE